MLRSIVAVSFGSLISMQNICTCAMYSTSDTITQGTLCNLHQKAGELAGRLSLKHRGHARSFYGALSTLRDQQSGFQQHVLAFDTLRIANARSKKYGFGGTKQTA